MKKPLKRIVSAVLFIILIPITTGCWDRVEINDRIFVLALAIDKFEPGISGEAAEDGRDDRVQQPAKSARNRIVVSIVFPNVGLLKAEGVIVPKGPKFAVSTVAPNISEAVRQFNTRFNGNIFFGHVKAIMIGKGLLLDEELLLQALDELERSHEIARNVDLISVKGDAKDALFIEPLVEPIVGTYIEQIVNQHKTGRLHSKDLGQIMTGIHETGGGLIPRMIVGDRELKIAGACLVKDYRFRAWLGELETRAVQWIDNRAKEDIVSVEVGDVSVPFEITELKRRMSIEKDRDNDLQLNITLEAEGNIAGYTTKTNHGVMDQGFIREVEKTVGRDMAVQCIVVMDKMQNEFGLDIWGIGDYVRKFHPEIWAEVKDHWAETFVKLRVNFFVDIKVRRVGIVK